MSAKQKQTVQFSKGSGKKLRKLSNENVLSSSPATSDLFDLDVDLSEAELLNDTEKTFSDEKIKDGIHLGSPTTSDLF